MATSRPGAPSDLLYETNTITFCSVIRGRCGLTGRCSFEHRNRNPSAGRGYWATGAGCGRATISLRATSRGARGQACHCGPSDSVLRVSPRLVWLPRMGTSSRLASPLITPGCERGTKADLSRSRNICFGSCWLVAQHSRATHAPNRPRKRRSHCSRTPFQPYSRNCRAARRR